jgi:hypothetical protein
MRPSRRPLKIQLSDRADSETPKEASRYVLHRAGRSLSAPSAIAFQESGKTHAEDTIFDPTF